VDQLHGESDGTLSGAMARWRPRIIQCYIAQFVGGMLFFLMAGLAAAIPGASWAGIYASAGLETAQQPMTVIPLLLLWMGLTAIGSLLVIRFTLFSVLSVVVEGTGQFAALRRSARLVDANWTGLLGVCMAIFGLGMGAAMVMMMVLFPLHFGWTLGVHLVTESEIARLFLGLPMDFVAACIQMGIGNFFSVAWTLIFLRERARLTG
jgi:hypothetical protein